MEVLGSIYTEVSDRFQKGIVGGIFPDVQKLKNTI
jgi:hypothetical protein|nr:MAG TPA: hypothetical protein [Bacteriophage sp.]